jgi:hypothetical protein
MKKFYFLLCLTGGISSAFSNPIGLSTGSNSLRLSSVQILSFVKKHTDHIKFGTQSSPEYVVSKYLKVDGEDPNGWSMGRNCLAMYLWRTAQQTNLPHQTQQALFSLSMRIFSESKEYTAAAYVCSTAIKFSKTQEEKERLSACLKDFETEVSQGNNVWADALRGEDQKNIVNLSEKELRSTNGILDNFCKR